MDTIIRTKTLTDDVVEQLKSFIEVETLLPGDRFPTESELCKRLGVSRTVVREAIARLKARGILRSKRGSGVFVDRQLDQESNTPLAPPNLAELLEILELRLALEVEGARLAAKRGTASQMVELSTATKIFEQRIGDWDRSVEADVHFHLTIARATGNSQFETLLAEMSQRVLPHRQGLVSLFKDQGARQAQNEKIAAEHLVIAEAILSGDSEGAERAMRYHLEGVRRLYIDWDSPAAIIGVSSP
ncbi:MAG: FadR family transcriptional regulator [Gammaproteobacteria bacterium]|nr:FadR family transcriptional regulator [Gammaproteobacteria bacterium]